MINLFRDFPCNWSYHGDAHLLLDQSAFPVTISLQLRFTDTTEINVNIIWKEESKDDDGSFTGIYIKLMVAEKQFLVIQEKTVLMGLVHMPDQGASFATFRCYRMFIYYGWYSSLREDNKNNSFIQMKTYLNEEFSSMDNLTGSEFLGLPKQENPLSRRSIEDEHTVPYCCLNSGYRLKCGKSYVIHKQDTFSRTNIDTLYKLSFIDVIAEFDTQQTSFFSAAESAQKLENIMFQCCGFLSILCGYEVQPVYYTFTIYSAYLKKEVQGKLVPIWEKARISSLSKAWPKVGIQLHHNVEAFLECCPLYNQVSNGILQLKTTVQDVTAELKLYAACSAIEYFYSYWLRNMGGIQEMENAYNHGSDLLPKPQNFKDQRFKKEIENAKKPNGMTPKLSLTIRFLLDSLGIQWEKYIKDKDIKKKPDFLEVRNNLLHGNYTDGDIRIFNASAVARAIALEVMLNILKRISKSNEDFYTSIPVAIPVEDSRILPTGWSEMEQALNAFVDSQSELFWHPRTKEMWQKFFAEQGDDLNNLEQTGDV